MQRDPKGKNAPTHVLQSWGFSFATGILRESRTEGSLRTSQNAVLSSPNPVSLQDAPQ
jgi:hypothetical protein